MLKMFSVWETWAAMWEEDLGIFCGIFLEQEPEVFKLQLIQEVRDQHLSALTGDAVSLQSSVPAESEVGGDADLRPMSPIMLDAAVQTSGQDEGQAFSLAGRHGCVGEIDPVGRTDDFQSAHGSDRGKDKLVAEVDSLRK